MIYTISKKYVDYELKEDLYRFSLTKIAKLTGFDRTYISKIKHDREVIPYTTYLKIKEAVNQLKDNSQTL